MITACLIVLAVLAHLGRSLVMLCSVGGMAFSLWLTATRSTRVQILALFAGGVGAAFAAEAVHVLHHLWIQDEPDHGGFWVSAFLVGSIDVAAMVPAVLWSAHRRTTSEGGTADR